MLLCKVGDFVEVIDEQSNFNPVVPPGERFKVLALGDPGYIRISLEDNQSPIWIKRDRFRIIKPIVSVEATVSNFQVGDTAELTEDYKKLKKGDRITVKGVSCIYSDITDQKEILLVYSSETGDHTVFAYRCKKVQHFTTGDTVKSLVSLPLGGDRFIVESMSSFEGMFSTRINGVLTYFLTSQFEKVHPFEKGDIVKALVASDHAKVGQQFLVDSIPANNIEYFIALNKDDIPITFFTKNFVKRSPDFSLGDIIELVEQFCDNANWRIAQGDRLKVVAWFITDQKEYVYDVVDLKSNTKINGIYAKGFRKYDPNLGEVGDTVEFIADKFNHFDEIFRKGDRVKVISIIPGSSDNSYRDLAYVIREGSDKGVRIALNRFKKIKSTPQDDTMTPITVGDTVEAKLEKIMPECLPTSLPTATLIKGDRAIVHDNAGHLSFRNGDIVTIQNSDLYGGCYKVEVDGHPEMRVLFAFPASLKKIDPSYVPPDYKKMYEDQKMATQECQDLLTKQVKITQDTLALMEDQKRECEKTVEQTLEDCYQAIQKEKNKFAELDARNWPVIQSKYHGLGVDDPTLKQFKELAGVGDSKPTTTPTKHSSAWLNGVIAFVMTVNTGFIYHGITKHILTKDTSQCLYHSTPTPAPSSKLANTE